MKKYVVILMTAFVCLTNSVYLMGQEVEVVEPTDIPDRILSGKFAVVELISKVNSAIVNVSAESAESFNYELTFSNFSNVEELSEQLSQVAPTLNLRNPEDDIVINVTLKDVDGNDLFDAYSSFNLEKVYDKDGNLSYQKPFWAGRLWFIPTKILNDFPVDINEAYLINKNGYKYYLDVSDGVKLPRWSYSGNYEYIVIETDDGEYLYDFITGSRIDSVNQTTGPDGASFDGVYSLEEGEDLVLELRPEYGYNPWIEKNSNDNVLINVRSHYGYQPIGVWVTTLEKIRNGEDPEVIQYMDGMEIDFTDETTYLYFEFPKRIYNIISGGEKG